jgi:PadR family transcriptional regulator PadR
LEVQLKKGLIDALVLAIMRKEDAYGYKLLSAVKEIMDISESTLYPILRRLEVQGNLSVYQLEYNGRLRKYYRLTADGILRLEAYKKNLIDVKKIIDVVFA